MRLNQQMVHHSRINQARNALWGSFFLMGVVSMAWVPRIPEIKDSLALNNGQLGLMLLGSTCGALFGAQVAGRLAHTFGSRKIAYLTGVILSFGLIAMSATTHSRAGFFVALVLLGMGYTGLDVCLNTQAVAVERLSKARYMASFHGMWSVGSLLTTIIGGGISRIISPERNLVAIGAVAFFALLISNSSLLPDEVDGHEGTESEMAGKVSLFGKDALALWGIGFGMLAAIIAEGAASDWGAILLRENMGIAKGWYASAFASFALAMIVARFLGDRALAKWGAGRVVRIGGFAGGLAWATSIAIAVPLSDHSRIGALIIINIGFICAGLGIGPMFPAFIIAASSVPGIAPSVAIGRVGVISLGAFFIGPASIGLFAEVTSLPIAMAFPCVMLLVAGFQARTIHVRGKL